jgi:hypothetical protein
MKVHELILLLSELDPDAVVVLQKDAEGNGYSLLAGVDTAVWDPVDRTVYDDTDEATEDGGEEILDDLESCVVVWPV